MPRRGRGAAQYGWLLAAALIVVGALLAGCGEDEDPTLARRRRRKRWPAPPPPTEVYRPAPKPSTPVPTVKVPEPSPPPVPGPKAPPPKKAEQVNPLKPFTFDLPAETRPFPEPLPEGKQPGFKIRGIRGWGWAPEQYLAEIPVLAKYKMNFLMNCYISLFEYYPRHGVQFPSNKWWVPVPSPKREGFEEVVRACKKHGIEFCFSMNPQVRSTRPLSYDSEKDIDDLWAHYAWMQGLGVKWFSLCVDDIGQGDDPHGQAKVVAEILRRLRATDPGAQMIFCPTHYHGWGTGDAYLATLSLELPEDVYVFWTGPQIISLSIPTECAKSYRNAIKRRLIIWDNICANDAAPVLHLGPVSRYDASLCEVADGYIFNPHHPQNEINRIPMLTCADYAYNPWAYDPKRSIGQAILHLADTPGQRQLLKDLVELYPGRTALRGRTHCRSPLINRFYTVFDEPKGIEEAEAILAQVKGIATRLQAEFPGRYAATLETIQYHISQMQAFYDRKTGRVPADRPIPGWPIW